MKNRKKTRNRRKRGFVPKNQKRKIISQKIYKFFLKKYLKSLKHQKQRNKRTPQPNSKIPKIFKKAKNDPNLLQHPKTPFFPPNPINRLPRLIHHRSLQYLHRKLHK